MKEQLELYKKWAPDTAMWTQWAKPVVFMHIGSSRHFASNGINKGMAAWTDYQRQRLLIVDLAGSESVKEGIATAKLGYRPVPLYNGVPGGYEAVVAMKALLNGLRDGGEIIAQLGLANQANPVFLLDSNRLKGAKRKPGTFDNRWCVVKQDLPSADYLKKNGITEIVVRTNELQQDLQHLLYDYQKAGIAIALCGSNQKIQPTKIARHQRWGLFYRFLLLLGLARGATGGFGMSIPEVSSGGGGYRAG